jgi:hypothetical protein
VQTSTSRNPKTDTSKRVVIQYINYADSIDTYEGHGTHGKSLGCRYVPHGKMLT